LNWSIAASEILLRQKHTIYRAQENTEEIGVTPDPGFGLRNDLKEEINKWLSKLGLQVENSLSSVFIG
jgi:hypothetical protein